MMDEIEESMVKNELIINKPIKKEPMLPLTTIKRIMKEEGITSINKTALMEIRMILHDILKDMSRNIIIYTKHRNAKISNKDDVLLSLR